MKKEIHAEASSRLIFYLGDERLLQMKQFIQHGDVSTYDHCLLVAYYSFLWMRKLHIRCSEDELIRGALLHDYYLYDWHEKEKWHRMHGFRHPGFALSNAQRDFELSEKEKEIIRKHMWPLTIIPPTCREAWIVNSADTFISLMETIASRQHFGKMKEYWVHRPLRAMYDQSAKELDQFV